MLANDITFKASDFGADNCLQVKYTSIGYNGKQLKEIAEIGLAGTFNGLGYTLKNLVIGEGGMFGNISGQGTIKNLSIANAKFKVTPWKTTGIVANSMSGTLENINIDVDFEKISFASNYVNSTAIAYHVHDIKMTNVYISVRNVADGHCTIAYWVTGDSNKIQDVIINDTTNPYIVAKEGNASDAFSKINGVGQFDTSNKDVMVDDSVWY